MEINPSKIIDRYYPVGSRRRDIYLHHCRSVAVLAAEINASRALGLDPADVEGAAMLHDIGIVETDAPGLDCHGRAPYIAHGYLGADMLRAEGYPEQWARVAERHTGSGLTDDEIAAGHMPLPPGRCYMPVSTLEQLVCYADKFYSKSGDMQRKPLEAVRASLERHGRQSLERFDAMHRRFAIND